MTTTDPAWSREDFDAAEDAFRRAQSEVDRLRAKLAAELAGQDARGFGEDRPERLRWADGVAEARRRYGTSPASGNALDAFRTAERSRIERCCWPRGGAPTYGRAS